MITAIHPKLPMRNQSATRKFYRQLGFQLFGDDYPDYLMVEKDGLQIHFFKFENLDPKENYGQVYIRTHEIDLLHQSFLENQVEIHPNGHLRNQPWGQREFSVLDPDNNLLTFGQSL
jgi:catechol 2,3-dioxygenase-like lactoylglutathione lyase family enzyme